MSDCIQFIIETSIRPSYNELLVNKLTTNIRTISFDVAMVAELR